MQERHGWRVPVSPARLIRTCSQLRHEGIKALGAGCVWGGGCVWVGGCVGVCVCGVCRGVVGGTGELMRPHQPRAQLQVTVDWGVSLSGALMRDTADCADGG